MGTGQKDRRAPRKATTGPIGGIKHQNSQLSLLPRAHLSLTVSVQKGWRDKGPSTWQTTWYQLIPAGIIGGRCTSCEKFRGGARYWHRSEDPAQGICDIQNINRNFTVGKPGRRFLTARSRSTAPGLEPSVCPGRLCWKIRIAADVPARTA